MKKERKDVKRNNILTFSDVLKLSFVIAKQPNKQT